MKEYLIDTSFILSLANKDDKFHNEGKSIYQQFVGNEETKILKSVYAIDVLLTLIARKVNTSKSIEWGKYLFQEKWFDLIYTPSTNIMEAWTIYQNDENERFPLTFTDATIVAYCRLRKVDEILTFDSRLKNNS